MFVEKEAIILEIVSIKEQKGMLGRQYSLKLKLKVNGIFKLFVSLYNQAMSVSSHLTSPFIDQLKEIIEFNSAKL